MSYERTGHHANNIHRQHDDWDEVHNQLLAIQKKSLEVSNPGDADEKEADEVAKKVTDGESAQIHGTGGTINRKGEGGAETTSDFQSKLESSKGGGQSLNDSIRSEMETKMGADLSGVKVHTGSEANTMNENVNAKAFTHGQDIYFKEGQYSPESKQGKELIAHELVHTVQQSRDKIRTKIHRQVGEDHGQSEHAKGSYDLATRIYTVPSDKSLYSDQKMAYDTMSSIAKRFGLTSTQLMTYNGLTSDVIHGGDTIRIPTAADLKTVEAPVVDQKAVTKNTTGRMNEVNTKGSATSGVWYASTYYSNKVKYDNDPTHNASLKGYSDNWQNGFWDGYTKTNGTLWIQGSGYKWTLKPGASPSQAIKEWFNGLTIAECFTTTEAIFIDSIRIAIGDAEFDKLFASTSAPGGLLSIGTSYSSFDRFRTYIPSTGEGTLGHRPANAGEWHYFYNNPKYLLKHPNSDWQGENIVCLGEIGGVQYWEGFGTANLSGVVGKVTEEELYQEMMNAYNEERSPRDYQYLVERYMTTAPEFIAGITKDADWEVVYKKYIKNPAISKVPAIYIEEVDGGKEFKDELTDLKQIYDKTNTDNQPYTYKGTSRQGGWNAGSRKGLDMDKLNAIIQH